MYVTPNIYDDNKIIGYIYLFFGDKAFCNDLYSNGHFLVSDSSGNVIINTFGEEYIEYKEDEIDTIKFPVQFDRDEPKIKLE